MTPCEAHLRQIIATKGSVSLAEFMNLALYHPELGYYMTHNPLGDQQDFVTAPEVSQLFGQVLCLWAVQKYEDLQKPERFALIELGPGRGLLMSDLLKAAQAASNFYEAIEVHLVEISPLLKKEQKKHISHKSIKWHNSIKDAFKVIGNLPTIIIANEFFDALPIEQFYKNAQGWHQRHIILDEDQELKFSLEKIDVVQSSATWPASLFEISHKNESIIEYCAKAEEILRDIVQKLRQVSGAALLIDYGYKEGHGDSLQAVSKHQYVPALKNIGKSDLTAHVNFARLQKIAGEQGQLMTQRDFLFKHGLLQLAQGYAQNASSLVKEEIEKQVYKLTSSQEMGTLFKTLEIRLESHA